jgi:hypothetical protein
MTQITFNRLNAVTKWLTIVFAWCAWGYAVYNKSILFFILGFVPYLVVYNWLLRGVVQRRIKGLENGTGQS